MSSAGELLVPPYKLLMTGQQTQRLQTNRRESPILMAETMTCGGLVWPELSFP